MTRCAHNVSFFLPCYLYYNFFIRFIVGRMVCGQFHGCCSTTNDTFHDRVCMLYPCSFCTKDFNKNIQAKSLQYVPLYPQSHHDIVCIRRYQILELLFPVCCEVVVNIIIVAQRRRRRKLAYSFSFLHGYFFTENNIPQSFVHMGL